MLDRHLTYTIPPALLLTAVYFPLFTARDLYKTCFLIAIAVAATIPWDSYLIRTNIWSYPPSVILGPTILYIPVEEVFFFVVQTYNTTLLYLLLSKPILGPVYMVKEKQNDKWKWVKLVGQLGLALGIKRAVDFIRDGGERTYLGLILVWALPFVFLLWSLGYQFLVRLPITSTVIPIAIPTLYLWVVDTLALKRGTWVIETGTKTGWTLWPNLEIEEAIFFLLTNCLIVFGLVAFDNALAILDAFPKHFPDRNELPSPAQLVRALLLPAAAYFDDRILGLEQSVDRLKRKSRSFYLASSTFTGRLRIDLILLYSFCRVADDLIDNAASISEAKQWLAKLKTYLDLRYSGPVKAADGTPIPADDPNAGTATRYTVKNFPRESWLTLLLLPTSRLSSKPLYDLLAGFEMDLAFSPSAPTGPIKSEPDLDLYGARVAGTVAHLCIELVLFHHPGTSEPQAKRLMAAGHDMGIALQYTNIARDLAVDAATQRVYVPPNWLKKEKMTPDTFLAALCNPPAPESDNADFLRKKIETVRSRLLGKAFQFYEGSVDAVERLPRPARGPMRVAVESYMQIARELRRPGYTVKRGRATVPGWKRVWVGWRRMLGPRRREEGEGGRHL